MRAQALEHPGQVGLHGHAEGATRPAPIPQH
jgi:hypothetical protein